jgi:hypothetical protein
MYFGGIGPAATEAAVTAVGLRIDHAGTLDEDERGGKRPSRSTGSPPAGPPRQPTLTAAWSRGPRAPQAEADTRSWTVRVGGFGSNASQVPADAALRAIASALLAGLAVASSAKPTIS